jgi:hypothetical protein
MKTLFRDWGDTAGTGDGGFETGAIVVKNLERGTSHAFDADLAGRFANGGSDYNLTVDTDDDTVNDAVAFTVDATTAAPAGSQIDAGATGTAALEAVVAMGEDATISRVMGTYMGVRGSYTCGTTDCEISRATGGSTPYTLGAGNWQFTPAAGARVRVPDQDWMAYGAWMTTPDNPAGVHRIGVLHNGFDPYTAATDAFEATSEAGLHGSATYSGGAAGIYVDGTASGLFTATATLTANFDVDGDGSDETGDYTISGQINDFRGTDGVYLGDDTQANRNDPVAGGENDWVVLLNQVDLADTGAIPAASTTAGSADGLLWTGNWSGQLYGPNADADGDAIAPSGVAGQFDAATTAEPAGTTAVVGAFGATKDDN